MKQAKIDYNKCKKKMPNRPPDEIDFGLGFRAALRWIKKDLDCGVSVEVTKAIIDKELQ